MGQVTDKLVRMLRRRRIRNKKGRAYAAKETP
jgi:hypothetical protein